ncbi:phage flumu protein gp47 [hydrocarbon metagenome]|uniref:Phage flumu protein gp47 n=1 Tax=hydrocarbon metagenome TaxID=938273 RepID=A0A0W8FUR1_9ZZZZ
MNFQKEFDVILAAILADWQNQYPEADLSQGSLIYMKSACQASMLWGLYKYQEYICKQIFPDTADTAMLEHHAWIHNITRKADETDAELLERVLDYIRRPPAGGNQYDYIRWAKEVDNVAQAYCVPIPTLGQVNVIILADADITDSELPSSSARIGTVTSVSSGKLIDSGATFTTSHAVAVGDIVENPLRGTRTTVTTVDSATQLTLAANIFSYTGEPYIVHCQTGTNTTATANKLIDSSGIFDNATYTVKPGDIVENVTDNTETTVVTVDSATQLTLTDDIFTATGKTYVIRGLIAEVKKYIDPLRPVTASKVGIIAPTVSSQNVTMTVTGTNVDKTAIAASIEMYLNSMIPAQVLYKNKLVQIAMDAGADNVTISAPATDVTPTTYQMVRAGTITVS